MDKGRVHDRTSGAPDSLGLQVQIHGSQNLFSQIVLLQQMPELAHRGFVRHRLGPQVNPRKLAQRRRVVQRLFHCRVRQVEPLLQKINPQHLLQFFGPTPAARFVIVGLDQGAQLPPRHHLLHLFQKHWLVASSSCTARIPSSSPVSSADSSSSCWHDSIYTPCGKGALNQSLPRRQGLRTREWNRFGSPESLRQRKSYCTGGYYGT